LLRQILAGSEKGKKKRRGKKRGKEEKPTCRNPSIPVLIFFFIKLTWRLSAC